MIRFTLTLDRNGQTIELKIGASSWDAAYSYANNVYPDYSVVVREGWDG